MCAGYIAKINDNRRGIRSTPWLIKAERLVGRQKTPVERRHCGIPGNGMDKDSKGHGQLEDSGAGIIIIIVIIAFKGAIRDCF